MVRWSMRRVAVMMLRLTSLYTRSLALIKIAIGKA